MQFTQFYTGTSVCAPSRSSLLTGQHTSHTYIRGNKEVRPEGQQPLADSVITVAELLKKAGYETAAFGKWGLGPVGSSGDPTKQGFDRFYDYNCQALAHRAYPNHLWNNEQKIILTTNRDLQQTNEYAPNLIHKRALAFLDEPNKNNRFFYFFLIPYPTPNWWFLTTAFLPDTKENLPKSHSEGLIMGQMRKRLAMLRRHIHGPHSRP